VGPVVAGGGPTVWPPHQRSHARHRTHLLAATPKFEVKRHRDSGYSNDYMPCPPGGYSASNFAGSAYNLVSKGTFQEGVHYFKPTKRKLLFYWPAIEKWIREEHNG